MVQPAGRITVVDVQIVVIQPIRCVAKQRSKLWGDRREIDQVHESTTPLDCTAQEYTKHENPLSGGQGRGWNSNLVKRGHHKDATAKSPTTSRVRKCMWGVWRTERRGTPSLLRCLAVFAERRAI
jgi:hypothetical protein